MAMTAEERLNEVETAITKVLCGGQMQKELQAEVAAGSDTGLFDDTYVAFFDGR